MKLLLFFFLALAVAHAKTLTLGVFTYRSAEKIMEEYQPIAEHISRELNASVIIKPLDQKELENEVNVGNIDIIATNPTHYLSLQKQGKTTGAIATVVKRYGDVITPYLGGVIVTRADRRDIRAIADLKNKTIAIPNKKMLGGYLTQTYELFKAGINIAKDCNTPIYESHIASVEAVISGEVDAGFVRSGILEEMAAENKLNMNELFVINALHFSNFPLKISTNLYAEWSIVASKKLDVATVSKIAVALYGYKNDIMGNDIISGFTIPGDYSEIDTLARLLRIPPYDKIPSFTLEDIWQKYGQTILIFTSMTTFFFVLLVFLYRKARFERKYAQSILNTTPSPIIVTNGSHLISANTAFLKLVDYETLEAFLDEHDCICDYFEDGETKEYLSASMNEDTWIEYILANPEYEHKVKMTINGVTKFFKVAVSVVEHKNLSRYIVIFDDISQLLSLSTVDALTNIANRMHFDLILEHSFHQAQREKTLLSLIFFDIDHFKKVNDTYGHMTGDLVLKELANLVKNNLRQSDTIARWGGEEFIIILPNTSISSASHLAQKLQSIVENEKFEIVNKITCSFGVTQLRENEEKETLLTRLDELLYKAKESGRNRVVVG